jgi:hypothetical protein
VACGAGWCDGVRSRWRAGLGGTVGCGARWHAVRGGAAACGHGGARVWAARGWPVEQAHAMMVE